MFLTSTCRLPGFKVGETQLNLYGMEPCFVEDAIVPSVMSSPFGPQIIVEEQAEAFKKVYFKGCLEKKPDAKLLVIRYGGIGDIQWIMPTLREIKKRYPKTHIKFVCFEKDREVIVNCPFIDSLTVTHYPTSHDVMWADYVLDYFDTVEGIGTDEAKHRNPIDISAEIAGVTLTDYSGWYGVGYLEDERAKVILRRNGFMPENKLICMPLVASSPHRSWNRQDEVIKMIYEWNPNYKVAIFADNTPQAEPIVSRCKDLPNVINMAGKTSLREMMAMISLSDMVLSNDTGAVNLSAALGKKVIAIYTTVPKETRINHYPTVTGIQAKTGCSPCYKLSEPCPHGDRCLMSITADEVFKTITEKI